MKQFFPALSASFAPFPAALRPADALSAAEREGVPGRGDYVLRADTRHAIEPNVAHAGRERLGPKVRFPPAEDAISTGRGREWVAGRQTAYHPIR